MDPIEPWGSTSQLDRIRQHGCVFFESPFAAALEYSGHWPTSTVSRLTPSGKYWVHWANVHARNSKSIDDLAPTFRKKVESFVKALTDGGANVHVLVTRRSAKRAYLFHWSWMIAFNKCKPSEAKAMVGVDIAWDHGSLAKSRAAAMEMVNGFGLAKPPKSVYPPSLTSNHISGRAIDMIIKWEGTIKVKKKNGSEVALKFKADVDKDTELQAVGASWGVKKLRSDDAHWSYNGH